MICTESRALEGLRELYSADVEEEPRDESTNEDKKEAISPLLMSTKDETVSSSAAIMVEKTGAKELRGVKQG
jgi:hypothetical protein